jgi:cellulose synthase/poly-beta-1,6-N-acetylglucosamine synthase-like glycosyltransferase
MFHDWIHWLSSLSTDELLWLLAPVLLLDITRYTLGCVWLFLCDFCRLLVGLFRPAPGGEPGTADGFAHCPDMCVVIAGLNEASTVTHTLASLHGTYPKMEVIVVDDGSNDGMAEVARRFADDHAGVLVLRKPRRGGKSSALNFAIPFTSAEIIVCVDGDSQLNENALWEIVQPFTDPAVGAVSGTVIARNPFASLATWLQGLEYLRCIFVGRRAAARLNMLGIISGAFGAYRRAAIQRLKGWDVGPGEDGDLTLRLRKSGYRIAFAPYAQCLTKLPVSWLRLLKQRRRWEWAVITFECRKHVDMANLLCRHFRFANLFLLMERWTYNVLFTYVLWGYACWTLFHLHEDTWKQYLLYYFVYVAMEFCNLAVILYYSTDRRRDLLIGLSAPLAPLYNILLRGVTLLSVTEELFTRRSFRDSFVPEHVREATWHW